MNGRVAPSLAEAWIGAWNRHDLETILHHYAPDVECISPFVPALSGDPSGTLHGRERLTAYFLKDLQAYPDPYAVRGSFKRCGYTPRKVTRGETPYDAARVVRAPGCV